MWVNFQNLVLETKISNLFYPIGFKIQISFVTTVQLISVAYEMFSWYKCLIVGLFFSRPRFLEWESFSDCAF